MASYVRALYDFSGETNTSELSITAGEVLTVTRTDVGEGWWEGKNSKGQVGLFPESYVEVLSAAELAEQSNGIYNNVPSQASGFNANTVAPRYDQAADDWNDGEDEWEDDWDEDNENYSKIGATASIQNNNARPGSIDVAQKPFYGNMNLPPTPADDTISVTSAGATAAPTIIRSGMFSKSGDSYILGTVSIPVPENEKIYILKTDNGYCWQPINQHFTVKVASPKKETKFKGMKSFIAYQLTPSFNNISVSRRYKHFDWLHERLVEKFCIIAIPPLPDKQISGRYEEQFIEHRRVQLQEFVDWVCRHPVLSQCEVWRHFLTCTDEKLWKTGKRAAEKDPLVGAAYCSAINPPEKQLLQSYVEPQIDQCTSFVHNMDGAVKNLFALASEQTKRYQTQAKKDFQKIGEGLSELARALEIDERRDPSGASGLSLIVGRTGGIFIGIGQLYHDQPKNDWIPFADRLHIYRGILGTFPDVLATHKGAMNKKKECERLTMEQKMGNNQLAGVGRRTDVISYAVLAEMTHFRMEREEHLKETIRDLINEQITFYQNIIVRLQVAQKQFQ